MKDTIITPRDKLQAMINTVQSDRMARTITIAQIESAVHNLASWLATVSTEKDAIGTVAYVDMSAKYTHSMYYYKTFSTWFVVVLTKKGWTVEQVMRGQQMQSNRRNANVILTDATKKNMAAFMASRVNL